MVIPAPSAPTSVEPLDFPSGRRRGLHLASLPSRHHERRRHHQRANPRVSVVIPTLNEAANLPRVFRSLPEDLFEVVIVDGYSTDGTIETARRLRSDVRVVEQDKKGKGNALTHGFEACRGDIIVTLDADGSADPEEIPAFVAALMRGGELAKGTRFSLHGGSADITPLRRTGNRALTGLVNVLFRTDFSDLCYGYNAFWRRCLTDLSVDCDGFEVETLINLRAAKAGLRIAEVPSYEASRLHGETNLRTFRDGFRVLRTILTERFGPSVAYEAA